MKSPASFQYRANLFQSQKTISLMPDALRVRGASGGERVIPLAQIAKVDLLQRASLAHGAAYVCRLWRAGALFPVLVIGSKSFRGFNDFEAKDSSYRAFVTALHATLAKANPHCRFETTVPESALLHSLLAGGHVALPLLMAVFLAALMIAGDIAAAVVSTIIVIFGCAAFALLRPSKYGPSPYDPAAIPDAMLPRQGGEVFTD
jgi:hypothetical protein